MISWLNKKVVKAEALHLKFIVPFQIQTDSRYKSLTFVCKPELGAKRNSDEAEEISIM